MPIDQGTSLGERNLHRETALLPERNELRKYWAQATEHLVCNLGKRASFMQLSHWPEGQSGIFRQMGVLYLLVQRDLAPILRMHIALQTDSLVIHAQKCHCHNLGEHQSGFHLDLFSVLPCEHAP